MSLTGDQACLPFSSIEFEQIMAFGLGQWLETEVFKDEILGSSLST